MTIHSLNMLDFWSEAGETPAPGLDPAANQAPATDPYAAALPDPNQPAPPQPPQDQQPQDQAQPDDDDDVTQDPQQIDAPNQGGEKDFEVWKHEFFELAKKADAAVMLDAIGEVRDRPNLAAPARRFVEDNLQITLYRQDPVIEKASRELRKLVKQDMDMTTPGTTIMQHLCTVMEQTPQLAQLPIKLMGTFAWKGDLHRKAMAALLGAVQTGGGGSREDIVLNAEEYAVEISTRFYTEFGEVDLGKWSLAAGDPARFLKPAEREGLEDGSPGFKQELRRKVIVSSIADRFERRAFLVHVCHTDGTLYSIGWDVGDCLRAAYRAGQLVVRQKETKDKDCKIAQDGAITPLEEVRIFYVKDTGELDENGAIQQVEIPFMEERSGKMYLIADGNTVRDAAAGMSGIFFRELPYSGNPSDVNVVSRCTPSVSEILNRKCYR